MFKFINVMAVFLVFFSVVFQLSFVNKEHNKIVMKLYDLKTGAVYTTDLENSPVINEESIRLMGERAVSLMFNARPGLYAAHVDDPLIKELFVSDYYYQEWKSQFRTWLSSEFIINNISIKEAVSTQSRVFMSPLNPSGVRLWRFTSSVPMLNRALGTNQLTNHYVSLDIVYLADVGQLGIYGVDFK